MEKPEITEIVNAQMPLGATLGIRMFGGPDEVDATLDWAPELVHGRRHPARRGAHVRSPTPPAPSAPSSTFPRASRTTTIESKTNFLGAVREGSVRAQSRPLHVGKTTIVVETDLLDATGRRVARTTQTQAVLSAETTVPPRASLSDRLTALCLRPNESASGGSLDVGSQPREGCGIPVGRGLRVPSAEPRVVSAVAFESVRHP